MTSIRENERCLRCRDNSGYEASLEAGRAYRLVNDPEARRHDLVRVIDETGEDYVYPSRLFSPLRAGETATAAK